MYTYTNVQIQRTIGTLVTPKSISSLDHLKLFYNVNNIKLLTYNGFDGESVRLIRKGSFHTTAS